MERYIYTNKSTPEELQEYLDDVKAIGTPLYQDAGFDVVEGEIVGKSKGFSRPDAQRTTCFDTVKKKYNATGYYCLNAKFFYQDEEFVGLLPNHEDYTGLYDTDDVSQWVEPE